IVSLSFLYSSSCSSERLLGFVIFTSRIKSPLLSFISLNPFLGTLICCPPLIFFGIVTLILPSKVCTISLLPSAASQGYISIFLIIFKPSNFSLYSIIFIFIYISPSRPYLSPFTLIFLPGVIPFGTFTVIFLVAPPIFKLRLLLVPLYASSKLIDISVSYLFFGWFALLFPKPANPENPPKSEVC